MSERLAKLTAILASDPADTFILYALAQEHAKRGDHAQAITYYDRTLASDPAYCYAYFHKARSQQAEGDVASAVQTVRAGLLAAQKAGDGKALGELSSLLDELGEAGEGA
ncbi:MAG: hypothetical protein Q8L55_03620 [Phycisphaerales bacterium]|nr:hypothetical protein [Phycisphaerales bacterium]